MKLLLFSDLHLKPTTRGTCLKVLRHLNDYAARTNSELCFLGDWFCTVYRHATVDVELMNTCLRFFTSELSVPLKMLIGNHDMTDLNGQTHALDAFAACSPLVTVIDKPYLDEHNVLWVPYIRNTEKLLKAFHSQPARCIFAHFDLISANMGGTACTEGLNVTQLPAVPIYTGHFHKPQRINNVTYVGSPYQTSQAEWQDKKRAIILDTEDFSRVESLPLHFGPKRFKTSSLRELNLTELKQNDVITLSLAANETLPAEVKALRKRGVDVKIKRAVEQRPLRFEQKVTSTPADLVKKYAEGRERNDVAEYIIEQLKQKHTDANEVHGSVTWKEMRGVLGPFTSEFYIDFQQNGLTLVAGVRDNDHSKSNGSGKSMVSATCFLWILTGQTDLRAGGDSADKRVAVASVVNPALMRARGHLIAEIGGKHVKIERAFTYNKKDTSKGKHRLRVFVDKKDVTRATLDSTQKLIAEMLGVPSGGLAKRASNSLRDWLLRTAVWSQAAPPCWLEASDKAVKQELGWLADLQLWKELEDETKQKALDLKHKFARFETTVAHAKMDMSTIASQIVRMKASNADWERNHAKKVEDLEHKISIMPDAESVPHPQLPPLIEPADNVKANPHLRAREEELWSHKLQSTGLQQVIDAVPHPITVPTVGPPIDLQKLEMQLERARASCIKPNVVCETCGRAFVNPVERAQAEAKYDNAKKRVRKLELNLQKQRDKMAEMEPIREQARLAKAALEAQEKLSKLKAHMSMLEGRIAADKELESYQRQQHSKKQREYSEEKQRQNAIMQEYHMKLKQAKEMKTMKDEFVKELAALKRESSPFGAEIDIAESRLEAQREKLDAMQKTMENGTAKLAFYKEAITWLGSKGIPTYIMDNVLRQIEVNMVKWCARLFDEEDFLVRLDHAPDGTLVRRVEVGGVKATLSGGQYRRIQIAAWWAFREAAICRSGIDQNVAIFDEATHSLDVIGVEALNQGLKQWCGEDHRRIVMLVTHERAQFQDSSGYAHMIRVVRNGNTSTISAGGKQGAKTLKLKTKIRKREPHMQNNITKKTKH